MNVIDVINGLPPSTPFEMESAAVPTKRESLSAPPAHPLNLGWPGALPGLTEHDRSDGVLALHPYLQRPCVLLLPSVPSCLPSILLLFPPPLALSQNLTISMCTDPGDSGGGWETTQMRAMFILASQPLINLLADHRHMSRPSSSYLRLPEDEKNWPAEPSLHRNLQNHELSNNICFKPLNYAVVPYTAIANWYIFLISFRALLGKLG